MKESQEMKMELLKQFAESDDPKTVEFCREAYKFLMEGETEIPRIPISGGKPKDGIYIIFKGGQYKPFEKSADFNKEDVEYIGVIHEGHPFAVALKDLGRFQLLKDDVECPKKSEFYQPRECEALNDWECVERTKHIQSLGTDIPVKDGEAIPALPMVVAMCYWAKRGLNEALEFVGGEPLDMDSNYWSVTEYSQHYAWYVSFNGGNVYSISKCNSYVVRPVAAFNL